MKKILSLLTVLVLIMMLATSCKKDNGETSQDGNDTNDNTELVGVDILNDDLSEYVEVDEKYYKNYTVTVDPNRVSALDVENEIIQILCQYKDENKISGDGVITVGDIAHIYYKGYYMKDGEPYYFDGGCNMDSESPYALEIGSGGFIPGFEYNLIGKNPSDYTEDNPIVVETFFPEDYGMSELAGVTAYFIVEVAELEEYDAPELDVAFITETLKISDTDLASFEGNGVVEQYKSYVREQIMIEKGLDTDSLILDAFWDSVMNGAVIKKYPEEQITEAYDALLAELEYYYNYYYASYYEYDDFMCLYLGFNVGSDWKSELTEIAKSQVKQQMIFYHIMNKEGMKPSDEEYAELFDEYLVAALEDRGITPEEYSTQEEYLTAKENLRKQLIESNGEDYFKAMIYYEIAINEIIEYANVVNVEQ